MPTFLVLTETPKVTGRVRSEAKVGALRHMGIEHLVRPEGKVVALRSHVEQVLGVAPARGSWPRKSSLIGAQFEHARRGFS